MTGSTGTASTARPRSLRQRLGQASPMVRLVTGVVTAVAAWFVLAMASASAASVSGVTISQGGNNVTGATTQVSTPKQSCPEAEVSCTQTAASSQANHTGVSNAARVGGTGNVHNVSISQGNNTVTGVTTQVHTPSQTCDGPDTCVNTAAGSQSNTTGVHNAASVISTGLSHDATISGVAIDQGNNTVFGVTTQIANGTQTCTLDEGDSPLELGPTCTNTFAPTQAAITGVANEATVWQRVDIPGDPSSIADVTINQGGNNVFGVTTQVATANQACGVPDMDLTGATHCTNVFTPRQSNLTGVHNAAAVVQQIEPIAELVPVVPAAVVPVSAVPVTLVPTAVVGVPTAGVRLPATGSAASRLTSAVRPDDSGMLLPQLIAGLLLLLAGLSLLSSRKMRRQIMHRKLA